MLQKQNKAKQSAESRMIKSPGCCAGALVGKSGGYGYEAEYGNNFELGNDYLAHLAPGNKNKMELSPANVQLMPGNLCWGYHAGRLVPKTAVIYGGVNLDGSMVKAAPGSGYLQSSK